MKKLSITYNAPVTLTFVLLCAVATLIGTLTGGIITEKIFMTYRAPFSDPLMYLRLLTHVFGHEGWSHFIANASYLLLLGPMLEEKHGSGSLVGVIAITALVTGVVNNIFFPGVGLCGASGIVFAFILLASFTSFRFGEIPLTFILVAALFIGQQVYNGINVEDNISNIAHIVGGIVGSIIGYNFNRDED